jgi:hypothetical protein
MLNSQNSPWSRVRARWESLRLRAATFWPRLLSEEVQQLPGDRASLVSLVRKRYALTFAEAEAQVDTWVAELEDEFEWAPSPSAGPPQPPPTRTKSEERAEAEGMGVVPGATLKPHG